MTIIAKYTLAANLMMQTVSLFSPLSIRGITLKNRVVVSPMWQYVGEQGFPTDWHLMNLGRLADGGAALVFQEGTQIERRGCGTVGDLGLWDDKFVEPMQRLVRVIRDNGAVPGIQLMHAGRKARQNMPWLGRGARQRTDDVKDWDAWDVIGPSAIAQGPGYAVPRAMTQSDIDTVIAAWITAAERAQRAGYEVLEIHAAHGYLLHSFLSPAANQRDDSYGGSLANRSRMLFEVVQGVRSIWPRDKPLFVRLSCIDEQGWSMEDSLVIAAGLRELDVDIIDCTTGGIGGPPMEEKATYSYGYQVPYAATLRREAGISTMAVGLIIHAAQADHIIASGQADLVALGREMIYNPNWPIDAAQKLGVDPGFKVASKRAAFWLHQRSVRAADVRPSTFDADPHFRYPCSHTSLNQ